MRDNRIDSGSEEAQSVFGKLMAQVQQNRAEQKPVGRHRERAGGVSVSELAFGHPLQTARPDEPEDE